MYWYHYVGMSLKTGELYIIESVFRDMKKVKMDGFEVLSEL